jgi:hypothetical protein
MKEYTLNERASRKNIHRRRKKKHKKRQSEGRGEGEGEVRDISSNIKQTTYHVF